MFKNILYNLIWTLRKIPRKTYNKNAFKNTQGLRNPNNFNISNSFKVKITVLLLLVACSQNESFFSDVSNPEVNQINIGDNYVCNEWLGSDNYERCLEGSEITLLANFDQKLNNIIEYREEIYLLQANGVIFKNTKDNIFIDITEKVSSVKDSTTAEIGLYGISFHPVENYFLVSYSNLLNELTIEKYLLDADGSVVMQNSEIIFKQKNDWCCHFAGSVIWSDYFQDFLISVGDMDEDAPITREPLITTSNKGKILFLTKNISKTKLIGINSNLDSKKNILAYGLRNPWKISVYSNFLFITDVGAVDQEELNLVDLDSFQSRNNDPYLFGWPIYEGNKTRKAEDFEYSEISLWTESKSLDAIEYVNQNSIVPTLYYSHDAPENYRAAIIGGAVIDNEASKHFEHYIFADYLSKELFSYNFKSDELFLVPLPTEFSSQITSLAINPNEQDSVLIATTNGELYQVRLPNF